MKIIFLLRIFIILLIQSSPFSIAKLNADQTTGNLISEIQLAIMPGSTLISSGFALEFLGFESYTMDPKSKINISEVYTQNDLLTASPKILVEKNKILLKPNIFNNTFPNKIYFVLSNIKTTPNSTKYKIVYTNLKTVKRQEIEFTLTKNDSISQKSDFNLSYSTEKNDLQNYNLKDNKKNIQIQNLTGFSKKVFADTNLDSNPELFKTKSIKIQLLNSNGEFLMETNWIVSENIIININSDNQIQITSDNYKIPIDNTKLDTNNFYKHPADYYIIPSTITFFILFFIFKDILSFNKSDIIGIIISILGVSERPLLLLLCIFSAIKSSLLIVFLFYICTLFQIIFSILFFKINDKIFINEDGIISVTSHKNHKKCCRYFVLIFDYKAVRLFYSNVFSKSSDFNLDYSNVVKFHFAYKSLILLDLIFIIMPLFVCSLFIVFNIEKFCFLWFLGIYCCYLFLGNMIFCLVDYYHFNEIKYKEKFLLENSQKKTEDSNLSSFIDTNKIIEEFERKKKLKKEEEVMLELVNIKDDSNLKNSKISNRELNNSKINLNNQINNNELNSYKNYLTNKNNLRVSSKNTELNNQESKNKTKTTAIENNQIELENKNCGKIYTNNPVLRSKSDNSKFLENTKNIRAAIIFREIRKQAPRKRDDSRKCVVVNKKAYKNINKTKFLEKEISNNDNITIKHDKDIVKTVDLMKHNLNESPFNNSNENENSGKTSSSNKTNENTFSKKGNKICEGDKTKGYIVRESNYTKGKVESSFIMYDDEKMHYKNIKEKNEDNYENNNIKDDSNNNASENFIEYQYSINDVNYNISKFENNFPVNSDQKINGNICIQGKNDILQKLKKGSDKALEYSNKTIENDDKRDLSDIENNQNMSQFTNSSNQDFYVGSSGLSSLGYLKNE